MFNKSYHKHKQNIWTSHQHNNIYLITFNLNIYLPLHIHVMYTNNMNSVVETKKL
jgi:hypothetical protein